MTQSDLTNSDQAVSAASFPAGEIVFDVYKIIELVGRGGMGSVYKAKNIVLDRVEALKVISGDLLSDKEIVRFQNEARALSRLDHRNIVTVFDFGVAGGVPYISMEFLEGETLDKVLKARGKLETDELIDIFLQVCKGLVHAHSKGVIHRDLKTTNIIVSHDQSGMLRVVLIDFGVAKVEVADESQRISATGVFVGSPLYVSPEQIDARPADARSDIYSLGCIMFQALSGQPPFQADSLLQLLAMHKSALPPIALLTGEGAIPRPLIELISSMLEKQAAARPPDVEVVCKKLSEVSDLLCIENNPANGKNVVAHSELRQRRLPGFPIKVIAAILLSVVLVPGIAFVMLLFRGGDTRNKELRLERYNLNNVSEKDVTGAIDYFLSPRAKKKKIHDLLADADSLLKDYNDQQKMIEAAEKYKECLELNQHMLGNRSFEIQRCYIGLSMTSDYRGNHEDAMTYLRQAKAVKRADLLTIARASMALGNYHSRQQKFREALDHLLLSIELYDKSGASKSTEAIASEAEAGMAYTGLNKNAECVRCFELAKSRLETNGNRNSLYVQVLIMLGHARMRLGRFTEAKTELEQAEQLMAKLKYKDKDENVFTLKEGLAETLISLGEYAEAERTVLSCKREVKVLNQKKRDQLDKLVKQIRDARSKPPGVSNSSTDF